MNKKNFRPVQVLSVPTNNHFADSFEMARKYCVYYFTIRKYFADGTVRTEKGDAADNIKLGRDLANISAEYMELRRTMGLPTEVLFHIKKKIPFTITPALLKALHEDNMDEFFIHIPEKDLTDEEKINIWEFIKETTTTDRDLDDNNSEITNGGCSLGIFFLFDELPAALELPIYRTKENQPWIALNDLSKYRGHGADVITKKDRREFTKR